MGLYWDYIGVILGLYWGYIGIILGLFWDYTALILYFASGADGVQEVWDYLVSKNRNVVLLTREAYVQQTKALTTITHKYVPKQLPKNAFYAFQYLHALMGRGDLADEREEEVTERTQPIL